MSDPTQILDAIIQEIDAGCRAAMCVVIATRGSTPQVPGTVAFVNEAGVMIGTVGGGCTEADVSRRAAGMLSDGGGGLFTFALDHDYSAETGPICGGQMDVAISVFSAQDHIRPLREAIGLLDTGHSATLPIRVTTSAGLVEYRLSIESAPKLVIAGGGHIGQVLAKMMVPLGFDVTVIDDRFDFASAERFPEPIKPIVGDIAEMLTSQPIDANTYVVIVTRGHEHDEQALGAVVNSGAKYVGMIGSRRKIKIIFDNLRRKGVSPDRLDRVHAPIGVDIKAVTVEEIAVSIAAELISVRRAEYRKAIEGPTAIQA